MILISRVLCITTIGSVIGHLKARDADETSAFKFSLGDQLSGSGLARPIATAELLAVDERTGELRLTRSFSANDIGRSFTLEVSVADAAPGVH